MIIKSLEKIRRKKNYRLPFTYCKRQTANCLLVTCLVILLTSSCGLRVNYSMTGAKLDERLKTIQVDFFPNNASLVDPALSQEFTQSLQDLFLRQTNLTLVNAEGDLQFEGEITGYEINPITANADQTADQNRLTITINVRFYNSISSIENFEKKFSHFFDFDDDANLIGSIKQEAFDVIIQRITQDIYNASLVQW